MLENLQRSGLGQSALAERIHQRSLFAQQLLFIQYKALKRLLICRIRLVAPHHLRCLLPKRQAEGDQHQDTPQRARA